MPPSATLTSIGGSYSVFYVLAALLVNEVAPQYWEIA